MTKDAVDYEILYTPISLVDGIWPVVNVHIESALKYSAGEYSLEDILSLEAKASLNGGDLWSNHCTSLPNRSTAHILKS